MVRVFSYKLLRKRENDQPLSGLRCPEAVAYSQYQETETKLNHRVHNMVSAGFKPIFSITDGKLCTTS